MDDESDWLARRGVRGRGTGDVPKGRFETKETVFAEEEEQQFKTEILKDSSRTIISFNDSPDLGFSASLNPYRGCEHGCIYCYARPSHEYFGLSAGLDFETKLFAKMEAASLLRKALAAKSWEPQTLVMSGITDCYQPIERELKITRSCLEVLLDFRNPAAIITKNHLVTRDIDVLQEMAKFDCAHVTVSITSLDGDLSRHMEPRASQPKRRLAAVEALSKAGIPVSVNIAPIVPGLTDHETPAILKAASDAGAYSAHYTMMRLPHGVKDLFENWIEKNYPLKAKKVMNRVRDVRGGKLYNAQFGTRMTGTGVYAEHIEQVFKQNRKKYGLDRKRSRPLSTEYFRRDTAQLSLFSG